MIVPEPELLCNFCNESWPVKDFTLAGSAYNGANLKKVCNACFTERFGRMKDKRCVGCGASVRSRKDGQSVCRRCKSIGFKPRLRSFEWSSQGFGG